jgi:hypothetical protein
MSRDHSWALHVLCVDSEDLDSEYRALQMEAGKSLGFSRLISAANLGRADPSATGPGTGSSLCVSALVSIGLCLLTAPAAGVCRERAWGREPSRHGWMGTE